MISRFLLLIISCCIFVSCSKDDIIFEIDRSAKQTLERERAAWNAQSIKNYQFTYYQGGGYVCEVYGDLTTKIAISENQEPLFIEKSPNFPEDRITLKSISDIYDMVDGMINDFLLRMEIIKAIKTGKEIPYGEDNPFNFNSQNISNIKSEHLIIKYNAQYHYPEYVDRYTEYKETVLGYYGGFILRLTEFTPVLNKN